MSRPDLLSLASTVVATPQQVSTRLADEVVILDLREGVYFGLDAVGARVWELLREPRTVQALRDAILAEYEVDAPTCERDLIALVGDLAGRGLVEVRG